MTPSELLCLNAGHWAQGQAPAAVAEMLIAAAFLANEAAGAMELEMVGAQAGPQPFVLVVHPGEEVPDWPVQSLEYQIWFLMAQGGEVVSDIVYDMVKEGPAPGERVVHFVTQSVAVTQTGADIGPVNAMLHRTAQERPDLWAELFAEIRAGLRLCEN